MMLTEVRNYELDHLTRPSAAFDVIKSAVEPFGVRFCGLDKGRLSFELLDATQNRAEVAKKIHGALADTVQRFPSLINALKGVEAIALR